jgi:hypothetical protein
MNSHLENAKKAALSYGNPNSVSNLNNYKQEYDNEKKLYEQYRNKTNKIAKTAAITIPIGLAVSAAFFYLSTKIIKPKVYSETPLLTLNTININSNLSSICSVGVILNINR